MAQLPAYLQNTSLPRLAETATEGMGGTLPPHVSIRGNEFTLVDASGEEETIQTKYLDVCIFAKGDRLAKLYYGKDWVDGANDPPLCWSANGIAPSSEAVQQQSATCGTCPQNVRGSAHSKLSGVAVKACRDELWTAILVPGRADLIFQFRITPGSFVNWRAYAEKFKGQPFDVKDVITRLAFEKGKNGVVTFAPASYIAEDMAKLRNKLITSKAADGIVGRLDLPAAGAAVGTTRVQTALSSPSVGTTEAQNPSEPLKPRGRPKKQAEPPQAGTPAPFAMDPPVVTFAPPPGQPANGGFGIATDAPAPPDDLGADLDSFFK